MEKESNIKGSKSIGMSELNQKILSGQKRLANHLNLRCRKISSKGLLVMLITFTAMMSALLLKLIICAIQ
ncbi:hypothetical protein [Pedobacter sp. BMA]|uniref:hypothetical protein n=1 Tax=Pedobacter sp. BMA TaxID=1663685 RepID=UPI0012E05D18|nr:hypothetical protein [Pedobacter sp. BMA]